MSNQISIRKATIADLDSIHGLVGELAAYENEPEAFTATIEEYRQDFKDGMFECLVAEITSGEIVGMTLQYLSYSTWKGRMLYLEDFVVKEAWRKHGIGQMLFDALFKRAEELKCRLVKWQVLDWNKPAVSFYNKNEAIIETNWWSVKKFLQ